MNALRRLQAVWPHGALPCLSHGGGSFGAKALLLVDGDRLVRRGLLQFILLHETQDRFHNGVFAHGGIDHGVIYRTVRPLRMEIIS